VYNHHLLVGKAEISSEELSAEEYSWCSTVKIKK
jgi:hypothetical protein